MKKLSFISVVVAALLWGSTCLFVDRIAAQGIGRMGIAAIRAFVAFAMIGIYMLIMDRKAFRVTRFQLLMFALGGLALFGSSASYFVAMKYISVAAAVVLMYTAPVMVMIFSVLFLGEKMTAVKGVCVGAMIVGCVLVSGILHETTMGEDGKNIVIGILLGLLSGISFAAYNVITKIVMRKKCSTLTANFYTFLFMAIVGVLFCDPYHTAMALITKPMPASLLLVLLGVLTGAVPYLLYANALRRISAGVASSISVLEPAASVILGMVFMQQMPTWDMFIGVILILAAVLLLALPIAEGKTKRKN